MRMQSSLDEADLYDTPAGKKNVCTVRAQHIAIFIHSYSCWYSVVADVTSIHLNKKVELEQRKKQREICLSAIWPKTVSV